MRIVHKTVLQENAARAKEFARTRRNPEGSAFPGPWKNPPFRV
jgi:hypothetical protein